MQQDQPRQQQESIAKDASPVVGSSAGDSPRERTLRHMRRLLGKAAKFGIVATACSCLACPDPLPPPPIDCALELTDQYLEQYMSWLAEWVDVTAVGPAISLNVYIRTTGLDFSGEPTAQDATTVYVASEPSMMTIALAPAEEATTVRVSIPVTCGEKTANLDLVVDVTGSRQAGNYPEVSLADQ